MRRLIGVLLVGALACALCCSVSVASAPTLAVPSLDLGAQLGQRVFHEASGVSNESFMRERAFHVDLSAASLPALADVPDVSLPVLADRLFAIPSFSAQGVKAAAYVAPAESVTERSIVDSPTPIPVVASYEDIAPVTVTAPTSHRYELLQVDASRSASSLLTFSNGSLQGADVVVPAHLGRVQFSTYAATAQSDASILSQGADRAVGAGATLNLRAGHRNLGVNVSSSFEQANFNTPTYTTNVDTPMFIPSYADVSKSTLSAGVTVPIARQWTGSFQVDSQHLLGGYGMPGLSNLDANNTIYGARVTFQLPKSSSAISLSAKQFHFQDNLVPTNAFVQTTANVDFTIKF